MRGSEREGWREEGESKREEDEKAAEEEEEEEYFPSNVNQFQTPKTQLLVLSNVKNTIILQNLSP